MTVHVVIDYVDGSRSEHDEPVSILATHDKLVQQGIAGPALVDRLLGDDWAAPPRVVSLTFQSDGTEQTIRLFYS